jgi:hypothetical protein
MKCSENPQLNLSNLKEIELHENLAKDSEITNNTASAQTENSFKRRHPHKANN